MHNTLKYKKQLLNPNSGAWENHTRAAGAVEPHRLDAYRAEE